MPVILVWDAGCFCPPMAFGGLVPRALHLLATLCTLVGFPYFLPSFLYAGVAWPPVRCWGLLLVRVSVPAWGFRQAVAVFLLSHGDWGLWARFGPLCGWRLFCLSKVVAVFSPLCLVPCLSC